MFISNPKDGVKEFVCIAIVITGLGSCASSGIHNLPGLGATFILLYLPAGHRITNDGNLLKLHGNFKGTSDLLPIVKRFTYYSSFFNKFDMLFLLIMR
jgi:hypothetical protein